MAKEHVKPRLLGHWGTTPGLNFIYVHLNRVIKQHDLNMIYITGPGHGGPGLVANTYLEGTYSEVYPNISPGRGGHEAPVHAVLVPGGIPSHVAPETPGSIHEGGELGYALLARLRRRLRQPRSDRRLRRRRRRGGDRAAGDELALQQVPQPGRATARCCRSCTSTATRSPTRRVLARISHEELDQLFRGYGYTPYFVEGDDPATMHQLMAATLDTVIGEIQRIQADARSERLHASARAGR